jgi:hypothetical protein
MIYHRVHFHRHQFLREEPMKFEVDVSDIHIHVHIKPESEVLARLDLVLDKLDLVTGNTESIMSSFDDLKAAQAATDAKIASVKADVEKLMALLAAIPPAGMTPEQQAALDEAVAHASSINDSLSAVDDLNP